MKLPAIAWTQRQSLKAVVAALDGQARFVGGAVRDTLLELPVTDIDLATPLLPDAVLGQLALAGIKGLPTGIAHGTITAVTIDGPVEITTLRRDVSTDGRRATVAFSDDWKEDAARRDFTINALSADPKTLEIYDYFGGIDDLSVRSVRFIGAASERIAEDHLRILRYFRFLARFGSGQADPVAVQACIAAAPQLKALSRERIAAELLKLLAAQDPRFAVTMMIDGDIFVHMLAAIDPDAKGLFDRLLAREQRFAIAPDAMRRLVALLPKAAPQARAIAASLKLSKRMRDALVARLHEAEASPATVRALAYREGLDAARDTALLFGAEDDVADMLALLTDWKIPEFPMTGGDLIALGLQPGPAVSKILRDVRDAWIAEAFPDKDRVRQLARAAVARSET
ncbi:MAG: CCA tRNA nucleotidyltransferase [Parasphingorhabdus sp.]|nr:CCA tRNA nucleotidyltransferase [Parasphingorhabdus sp.]